MQIEAARGAPRQTVDTWFTRAITADPARYAAYVIRLKLSETPQRRRYARDDRLRPGVPANWRRPSRELRCCWSMRTSARRISPTPASRTTCAGITSRRRQGVEDIRAAYEPYVAKFPDSQFHRSRYAQLAAWSGQWQTADEQLQAMGERQFSLSWFRSKDNYLRLRSEGERARSPSHTESQVTDHVRSPMAENSWSLITHPLRRDVR